MTTTAYLYWSISSNQVGTTVIFTTPNTSTVITETVLEGLVFVEKSGDHIKLLKSGACFYLLLDRLSGGGNLLLRSGRNLLLRSGRNLLLRRDGWRGLTNRGS
jgi:hypothetical protein